MAENNQHLKHGKALCGKVFGRFVETFNALVDFMLGIKGDAEGKNGEGHITYDRKNNIIRCDGCGGTPGGGGGGSQEIEVIVGGSFSIETGESGLPVLKFKPKVRKIKNVTLDDKEEDGDPIPAIEFKKQDVVTGSEYDTDDYSLRNTVRTITCIDVDLPTPPADEPVVFTAVPHNSNTPPPNTSTVNIA